MSNVGFWERARESPDQLALIDETGGALSARCLASLSNRISNRLVDCGAEPGDVVATLLPSGPELVAVMLATRQSGFYLLPLNPRAGLRELTYLVRDSTPAFLIAAPICARPEFRESVLAQSGLRVEWLADGPDAARRLERFLGGASESAPPRRTAGDTLAYTSGTTGVPKAVLRKAVICSPEDALRPALDWYVRSFRIDPEAPGTYLCACPLHYSGPLSFASYALHLGRTAVLMPQWNARLALAKIARYGVSEMFVVPYQLMDLVREQRATPGKYDTRSLRTIIHGAAPCPVELKEQALETFGEIVYESYGATEVAGTVATPWEARRNRGTVGRAVAPHEVRILDDRQQPCRPGETGLVYMKMLPGMEFSYKGDPQATRDCQVDGFATAGDLGFLDASGYLFLKGRASDVINCRGEKVHPVSIEAAAMLHPEVIDAVAFAEQCNQSGETVHLAVSLSSSAHAMAEVIREIRGVLDKSLKRAEMPAVISVVSEIPRSQSGKVRRQELRNFVRQASVPRLPG